MKTDYPAKVLLAWGEAISGNEEIRDWLLKNGYPEFGLFRFALLFDKKARQWYLDNGHHELMAMIKGVEGDKSAISWLEHVGQNMLADMARAGDGEVEAMERLLKGGHRIQAVICQKINKVKTDLDEDRKDPHKYPQR